MSFRVLKKSALGALVIAATTMGLAPPAGATLIGDTITIFSQANVPLDTWTDTVVVGAGIELDGNVAGTEHVTPTMGQVFAALFPGDFIDVDANSITIHYAAFGGPVFLYAFNTEFSGLDWTGGIPGILTNVTLSDPNNDLIGSNITFTDHGLVFQGTVDLAAGADFTLNLTAVHTPDPDPEPVPEPATLPILAAGLLGLLAMARRKRRA